jgi:hypothetical protein
MFEEWLYVSMTRDEELLASWYGERREDAAQFLAYCAGFRAGKAKGKEERNEAETKQRTV